MSNITNFPTNTVWTNVPAQPLLTGDTTMVMSSSIANISPALLKAQSKMGNASKDAKNPFFKSKYADLNSIREACTPTLNAEGITVLQPMVQKDGKSFVRTLLLHSTGEYIGSDTEVVAAKQNDPQAYGSAVSYARRYGLQALISLGAEDDDAEGSMNRTTKPAYTAPAKTAETPAASAAPKASFKKPEAAATPSAPTKGWS
jgi:hypothetical protein